MNDVTHMLYGGVRYNIHNTIRFDSSLDDWNKIAAPLWTGFWTGSGHLNSITSQIFLSIDEPFDEDT